MAKLERPRPDSRPAAGRTPSKQGSAQVRVAVPPWYLELMDQESKYLGLARRSLFMEMLLRRAAGQQHIVRGPNLPAVPPPELKDLKKEEIWLWHLSQDSKKLFDELCVRAGGINPKAWTLLQVNLWCGFPPTGPLTPMPPGS